MHYHPKHAPIQDQSSNGNNSSMLSRVRLLENVHIIFSKYLKRSAFFLNKFA